MEVNIEVLTGILCVDETLNYKHQWTIPVRINKWTGLGTARPKQQSVHGGVSRHGLFSSTKRIRNYNLYAISFQLMIACYINKSDFDSHFMNNCHTICEIIQFVHNVGQNRWPTFGRLLFWI